MAASVYHVISKEVENHSFGHNWSFRHTCMYKQPTLTKQWNYNIFVQIYIYFRYTARFFLGCAFFNAHLSIIRTSWETKKESLSYRKSTWKNLWGTSLFWQYAPLSMSFFVVFLSTPSPLPSDVLAEWPLKRYIILQWLVFCVMIPCVNS